MFFGLVAVKEVSFRLFTFYSANNFTSIQYLMRWAGHVARMGEDRGVHRVLVGKPEGRSPLGRPRRRW